MFDGPNDDVGHAHAPFTDESDFDSDPIGEVAYSLSQGFSAHDVVCAHPDDHVHRAKAGPFGRRTRLDLDEQNTPRIRQPEALRYLGVNHRSPTAHAEADGTIVGEPLLMAGNGAEDGRRRDGEAYAP